MFGRERGLKDWNERREDPFLHVLEMKRVGRCRSNMLCLVEGNGISRGSDRVQ